VDAKDLEVPRLVVARDMGDANTFLKDALWASMPRAHDSLMSGSQGEKAGGTVPGVMIIRFSPAAAASGLRIGHGGVLLRSSGIAVLQPESLRGGARSDR